MEKSTGIKSAEAHSESLDALLRRLGVDPLHGLTAAEAEARLATHGPNELPSPPPPNAVLKFLAQFANPIVLTLLVAAVVAVVTASANSAMPFFARYADALAIGLIVVINAVLGYYQERRAEKALDALKRMQAPSARARRDGKVQALAAAKLVPGDIVELETGDSVPSDVRILQTADLLVQESALTGESVPITKDAKARVSADAVLGERSNMLFLGTHIVRGRGRGVVTATGAKTELGKLSTLMSEGPTTKTPLEEKLDSFGKMILWVCLALSAVLFVWGLVVGQKKWSELLLEAVSLAVAAIPEGLPAVTTITLALGMQRMAKRGAIIRKLAAVETLGAATVICSDKTGTLTQNEMTVRELYAGGRSFKVTGIGYAPTGEIQDDQGARGAESPFLHDLLKTSALCNNAKLDRHEDGSYFVIGDPTEGALLTLAAKGGVEPESLAPTHKVVRELPFDSDRKRMTVITLDESGQEVIHTKGSADVLVPLCSCIANGSELVPLTDELRYQILEQADHMSARALRVLAIARREPSKQTEADEDVEQELTLLGLVGMIDPPRKGVKEAIATCRAARVNVVMITGDHKLTAVAIARELGLWDEGSWAITGAELDELSDEALSKRIDSARVFARVTAAQKLRIVRALRNQGHVVAMTGDGVNDAPALRDAHIGVAMGKDGTDVAREAADMVLVDDNFATIVEAIREGRAVYRNIQKFIFFLLSSNAGLLVAVYATALFPKWLGLRPLMILWINLVTNGLPALALGVDPPGADQMNEPPRDAATGLLRRRDLLGIALVGVLMGGLALSCYLIPWPGATDANRGSYARAISFSLLALSPMFHVLNCRSSTDSFLKMKPLFPWPLVVAVTLSTAIHLVSVLVPSLRGIFATYMLTGTEWLILLGLSFAIIPGIEALKLLQRTGVIARDLAPMSKRL